MHGPFVYNLALRMLRDPVEAEDLSQEAFVGAWKGLKSFRGDARFRTWLYRIVANLCYSRLPSLRAELDEIEIDETDASEPGLPAPRQQQAVESALLSAELREAVFSAMDELPASYKLLVNLRFLQGLRYAEIADVTGMPMGTVKTGLHRARRQLRERLEEEGVRIGRS